MLAGWLAGTRAYIIFMRKCTSLHRRAYRDILYILVAARHIAHRIYFCYIQKQQQQQHCAVAFSLLVIHIYIRTIWYMVDIKQVSPFSSPCRKEMLYRLCSSPPHNQSYSNTNIDRFCRHFAIVDSYEQYW